MSPTGVIQFTSQKTGKMVVQDIGPHAVIDVFRDAQNRLIRYFSNGGYEIYDGVEINQDNKISVCDITISIALNSRANRSTVWSIWQHRHSLEEALSRIPSHICLDDKQIPWTELADLVERFCRIKTVKEAVTTKILHKKRPNLIPVYDRVVGEFLRPYLNEVWYSGGSKFLIRYMELFRNLLHTYRGEIYSLCDLAKENGWHITPVRVLEVLTWMANEPKGEYR